MKGRKYLTMFVLDEDRPNPICKRLLSIISWYRGEMIDEMLMLKLKEELQLGFEDVVIHAVNADAGLIRVKYSFREAKTETLWLLTYNNSMLRLT